MTDNDGVALFSIRHPKPPWYKRLWFFVFGPRIDTDLISAKMEAIEIEMNPGAPLRVTPAKEPLL